MNSTDVLGQHPGTHDVVLAYLRAAPPLVWPLLVLAIVILFYRQIGRFIDRLREVGLGSASVKTESPNQANSEPVRPGDPPADIASGPAGTVVAMAAQRLRETLGIDQQPNAQQVQRLVNAAAAFNVAWAFERVNGLIFGSQIETLGLLNSLPNAQRAIVRLIYDGAAARNPDFYGHYPFEAWLNFLANNAMVTVDGDVINITDAGRAFYQYLVEQRLPLIRAN